MIATLIGVIFYGQLLDQDGVMNMNGAMFLFLTNMTFQNVFSVINVSKSNTFFRHNLHTIFTRNQNQGFLH